MNGIKKETGEKGRKMGEREPQEFCWKGFRPALSVHPSFSSFGGSSRTHLLPVLRAMPPFTSAMRKSDVDEKRAQKVRGLENRDVLSLSVFPFCLCAFTNPQTAAPTKKIHGGRKATLL
jgi:hypothetical protein